jgi:phosphatidate cytidylyltransferase
MALLDDIHRAQGLAQEMAKEAQEKAIEAARDAQEILRDAQEKALELARERALRARERARRATEAMPPGLLVRLGSSVIGIPLLLLLVFAEGAPEYSGLPFTGAVAVCALLGGYEYFKGLRLRGFLPTEGLAYIAIASFQLAAWSVSRGRFTSLLPALLALLVIATLVHQILRKDPEPIANIGATFLGVIYIGWLFSYLIFLRSLDGIVNVWPFDHLHVPNFDFHARGAWLVLYVFAVTWITDTGAFFTGMRFGKHPLAPRLSPKKTIEGAIGGLIAAMVMSMAWGTWVGLPWWHCLILGTALGLLAQVGDLCESAIKRDLGIKDFGTLLPGHGGILDRFDSLLFTAPIAYYYLVMVVPRLP